MNDIIDRAKTLANEIKAGAHYQDFLEAKAVVDNNPGYRDMIRDYMVLRAKTLETGDDSLERRKLEAGTYYSLEANADVNRFITAWRDVTGQICDVIDVFASLCPKDLPMGFDQ
ncbi:MAG: YlbF family regulator [Clostridiales bacterium]|jgi:cell fate (sporulation/competence/biofilm development) regulator YlbF (YheA/YmcA/DUF963 family)|nr:YlbF family regulator [Clostridiales bacterium]